MSDELDFIVEVAQDSMGKAIDHLENELTRIRAGKANPQMLEGVSVDYYGVPTVINQMANISVMDARTLTIQPWEKNMLQPIERAIINANLGRDHWPNCWSLALAGAGIKTGQVVGASDERGANVTERVVSMGDLYATIYKTLGIDWKKEYMSPIGRPIKIANSLDDRTRQPVKELLA